MAKNWSASEAINTLHEGTDTAAIRDIMTRFPNFALLAIKSNEAAAEMFSFMPEWVTARKVDSWIKNAGKSEETDEADEDEDEKPAKKANKEAPAKKKAKKADDDDDDEAEDDEDEEPAPKKKSKKAAAKKAKKVADDDDFDFE